MKKITIYADFIDGIRFQKSGKKLFVEGENLRFNEEKIHTAALDTNQTAALIRAGLLELREFFHLELGGLELMRWLSSFAQFWAMSESNYGKGWTEGDRIYVRTSLKKLGYKLENREWASFTKMESAQNLADYIVHRFLRPSDFVDGSGVINRPIYTLLFEHEEYGYFAMVAKESSK